MHHALAFCEGHGVPVDLLAALAVHGIEAEVFGVGYGGEEARGHGCGGALRTEAISAFHSGVRLKAFVGGGFVGFAGGFVEAELDDRDVGVDGREEVVEVGLG